MTHTPGPWRLDGYDGRLVRAGGFGGLFIANVYALNSPFPDDDTANANARLIAAAPELLEACRWAYKAWSEKPPIGKTLAELLTMLNAAIAKAEAL